MLGETDPPRQSSRHTKYSRVALSVFSSASSFSSCFPWSFRNCSHGPCVGITIIIFTHAPPLHGSKQILFTVFAADPSPNPPHLSCFSALAGFLNRAAIDRTVDEGAQSILLDLRHNPGGFFPGGIDVAR